MRRRLRGLTLVCLVVLALTGMAGSAWADKQSRRVVTYFIGSQPGDCEKLKEACTRGTLTHVLVGLFHLAWQDEAHTIPGIHLNNSFPDDPVYDSLWAAIGYIRTNAPKVKVMATFGGADVADFRQLLDPTTFWFWYEPLKNVLSTYQFDGLDLDIEEGDLVVDTANVEYLVRQLREDFPTGFLVSSAPVARALTVPGSGMSPYVDYVQLLKQGLFDWYNLQFYNSWGDLLNPDYPDTPDYDMVVAAGFSPRQLVAGVPTAWSAGSPAYDIKSELYPKFWSLAHKYHNFGGVYGWHFVCAQAGGVLDPVGWTSYAFGAQYGNVIASNDLLLSD
jgi:hypothetical protein